MEFLQSVFLRILNMSITAGYIILVVLFIRFIIRKAPKKYSYVLWSVVGIRLLCPISFSSIFSVFNLYPLKSSNVKNNNGTMNYITNEIGRRGMSQETTAAVSSNPVIGNGIIPSTGKSENLQSIIYIVALIWVVGMAALFIYNIISYIKLKHRVSTAVLYKDNIYECDGIPSPFVLGIIKPVIYIPFHLKDQEMYYILRHEEYHIRRRDHIIKLFSSILLFIYWFNPLIWVAYYCMSKDMEMSCDEKILDDIGVFAKSEYSRSLLSFAVNRRFPDTGSLGFGEQNVKERIKNILNFKKPKRWVTVLLSFICLSAMIACITNPKGKALTQAENPVQKENPVEEKEYITQLYSLKHPYIGDVSANGKLLSTLGISKSLGDFTIELETTKKPYILRINFVDEVIDRDTFDHKMCKYASYLLALIDNADEIQWSYSSFRDGEMNRYTVYWNEENLKTMGIMDIKNYGKTKDKLEDLMKHISNNFDSAIDLTYAKNVTDTNDGLPEDKKLLTMNDVLSQKDWNHLTLTHFKEYANGKTEEFDDKNALNSYIVFPLQYGNGEYELQVSYMKKDNQIDSILLLKKSDSDVILLYSDNPKYKINTDIKTFLKKKVSMSQFLSYKLTEPFVDGNYIATLGHGGGNLFLNNLNPPKSPGSFAPIEWYYPGGVLYLSDRDDEETSTGFNYYVTFENGKLVRGNLHENHSGYIGEPIILDNLKEQAVIMEVNHDLYTAADISEAEEAGKPIPAEKQFSTVYEIYFAREDSEVAYCIFLNKEYFSLKDAKVLAKSVKFTEKAFW